METGWKRSFSSHFIYAALNHSQMHFEAFKLNKQNIRQKKCWDISNIDSGIDLWKMLKLKQRWNWVLVRPPPKQHSHHTHLSILMRRKPLSLSLLLAGSGVSRLLRTHDLCPTGLARVDGASLTVTHPAPPPSVTFPPRPVFAGCRKSAGDWLERRECRSGGTGANTSIVEQHECWGFQYRMRPSASWLRTGAYLGHVGRYFLGVSRDVVA